jgi:hypothetical protein
MNEPARRDEPTVVRERIDEGLLVGLKSSALSSSTMTSTIHTT